MESHGCHSSVDLVLFGHNARIWDCYISDSVRVYFEIYSHWLFVLSTLCHTHWHITHLLYASIACPVLRCTNLLFEFVPFMWGILYVLYIWTYISLCSFKLTESSQYWFTGLRYLTLYLFRPHSYSLMSIKYKCMVSLGRNCSVKLRRYFFKNIFKIIWSVLWCLGQGI